MPVGELLYLAGKVLKEHFAPTGVQFTLVANANLQNPNFYL